LNRESSFYYLGAPMNVAGVSSSRPSSAGAMSDIICFDEGSFCLSERPSLRLETGSTKPASEKPAPT
jgi:hypothetical protein